MAPKTILLKGDPIRKECKAGGAITPGHLVAFDASGDLIVHGTEGGNAQPRFAVEQEFIGDGISDAYADDDLVQYIVGRPGDEVYAILAASNEVAKGDPLMSKGDGTLTKHTAQAVNEGGSAQFTSYVDAIVGYAMEAVTTTSGTARIRVEVA
jgi:hypothetical protein